MCGCIMIAAMAHSVFAGESAVHIVLITLFLPAGIAAAVATTLEGIRKSWLGWLSLVPFLIVAVLGYAGQVQTFR